LTLADGDCLALHDSVPAEWGTGRPVAVLVHGLAGCYRSGYMIRIGQKLWTRGFRVVRMDLRGSGRGISMARRPYHGGCSEEVRARERFFRIRPGMRFPRGCGIRLFDDLYTAPRNAFQGVDDYYGSAGAAIIIPRISVPTLILAARDDPFIDPESLLSLARS